MLLSPYVVCCRFEIYFGKKQHDAEQPSFDNKTGAAAVVRNLGKVVTDDDMRNGFRVVTIDRYYSGVPLLIQLLSMRIYAVGTVMTNRLGYCKEVINKQKKRKATDVRGSFKMARCIDIPSVLAVSWMDNKPVHFLSSGASACKTSVTRRGRNNELEDVSCPSVVRDYHRFMGGVDVHDQLRLQSYSLQTCYRFKKYYKSLFMGLIDLVVVNAYVTHVKCSKDIGIKPRTRAGFMTVLHDQLIKQTASDFDCNKRRQPMTASVFVTRSHRTTPYGRQARSECAGATPARFARSSSGRKGRSRTRLVFSVSSALKTTSVSSCAT